MKSLGNNPELEKIRTIYRKFAVEEAGGKSLLYKQLCMSIAEDADLLGFLSVLPMPKRQPNLFLAAVRYLAKATLDWKDFRRFVLSHSSDLHKLMRTRSTQTNEPARCAVLLPVLAMLPQPLALLEVGASAGLCLLPDYYRYDYGQYTLRGEYAGSLSPTFHCDVQGPMPRPAEVPRIAWRAGLDLNPLDITEQTDVEWLEALIWPEQIERLHNLRAAIEIARSHPPVVHRGDLRNDMAALATQAPENATLVVFHTAVLVYLASQLERDSFARNVSQITNHWISNEWPSVFPNFEPGWQTEETSRFLMMLNGKAVAWNDPHGRALDWGASIAGVSY